MVLWLTLLVIHGATLAGTMPTGGTPGNITVAFLSPTEVKVSWTSSSSAKDQVEKYDVTYKPTDASYRVVVVVAGNSDSVTLTNLKANTQYQVTVTAVRGGRKFRSRPVVFRTLEMPRSAQDTAVQITGGPPAKVLPALPPHPNIPQHIQVRGVEVTIVCLVLLVWVGAIILFFNRWGKIRMLLPYQPDYKDTQLKVPGSCQQGPSCQATGSTALCCAQRYSREEWGGGRGRLLMSRARINSAVYIGLEAEPLFSGAGRRTRSADQLVLPLLSVSTAPHDETTTEQHL